MRDPCRSFVSCLLSMLVNGDLRRGMSPYVDDDWLAWSVVIDDSEAD